MNLSSEIASILVSEIKTISATFPKILVDMPITHRFDDFDILRSPTFPSVLILFEGLLTPINNQPTAEVEIHTRLLSAIVNSLENYFALSPELKTD